MRRRRTQVAGIRLIVETGKGMVSCLSPCVVLVLIARFSDERWLEWLDSKIALLINRNGVDPRDYSGKSYDE